MSMDPERLEQEFNDQVRAANLALDAEARANARLVQDVLDPNVWHGTAADAFHKQMTHIETFMDQQSAQASMAAQAAGMTFAVSVRYRESFHDLADKTITVCRAKTNGIDQILAVTKLFGDTPAPDGEPAEIVDGYLTAVNQLMRSYEDNLGTIQSWTDSRRTDLDLLKLPLLEPLPPTTDVDSPDFRYENFSYREPVPGVDNTSVERERTSYVEEKPKPGGLIGPTLAGE